MAHHKMTNRKETSVVCGKTKATAKINSMNLSIEKLSINLLNVIFYVAAKTRCLWILSKIIPPEALAEEVLFVRKSTT